VTFEPGPSEDAQAVVAEQDARDDPPVNP
jgi:hypothetical protein